MALTIIDYLKNNSDFSSYNKHIYVEENKIEDKKNKISIKNSYNNIVYIPYSLHSELQNHVFILILLILFKILFVFN